MPHSKNKQSSSIDTNNIELCLAPVGRLWNTRTLRNGL